MDLRLGRLSWRFLLGAVLVHAAAGVATAVFGPSEGWVLAPMFAGLAALGVSALLGAASFLLFMKSRPAGRQRWRGRLLVAAAPYVIFVGMELLPHALGPCSISAILDGPKIPTFCERISHGSGFGGKGQVVESIDIKARWHTLSHALIGAIPLTVLYAVALRKWRPEILGRGSPTSDGQLDHEQSQPGGRDRAGGEPTTE